MIAYRPANVVIPAWKTSLAQTASPARPTPPDGVPIIAANVAIMAVGATIGLIGASYRKTSVGAVAISAGGGMFGVGLIFTILDLFGFKRPSL